MQSCVGSFDCHLQVGILDVDICGPSVPLLLGVEGKEILQCSEGWVPVYADAEQARAHSFDPHHASETLTTPRQRLAVMSIGFLLKGRDDAVIFRGPKKTAMIRQFLQDVYWGGVLSSTVFIVSIVFIELMCCRFGLFGGRLPTRHVRRAHLDAGEFEGL